MIKTKELFEEAVSLPVEIRTVLVNELLASLNPAKKEIDEVWGREAENRLAQIRSGAVQTRPGEEVFENIRRKYL
jgi:putative addiction module component (TIGR02574 family)